MEATETVPFADVVTSVEQLRTSTARRPSWSRRRSSTTSRRGCAPPIEASRFAFVATADAAGRATVSPKGGADGFVTCCSTSAAWRSPTTPATTSTTRCATSSRTRTSGSSSSIPGRNETIRLDGDAWVTTDPDGARALPRRRAAGAPSRRSACASTEVFFHCPARSSGRRCGTRRRGATTRRPTSTTSCAPSLPEADWPDWAR